MSKDQDQAAADTNTDGDGDRTATRETLVQHLKALAKGATGAAERLADFMLFGGGGNVAQEKRDQEAMALPTLHTYADGSQRMGKPPFPEKSPKEEEAERARAGDNKGRPQAPIPGQPVSGVDANALAASGGAVGTPEQAAADATEQLTADVLSGKSPNTPNPTTASDKPQLAGQSNMVTADQLEPTADVTQADLDKIAAQIEPKGNIEATEEEKESAAVQLARETKGVPGTAEEAPATDPKSTSKAKASK